MEDGMKMKTRRYDSRRRQQSVNDFGREDQYLRTAEEVPTRRSTHRKGSNQVYDSENGFRGRHLSESNGKYNYRGISGSRGDRDVKRQQSADRVLTEGTHRHRQKKYRYMEVEVKNAKFMAEADLPSTNSVHKDKKSKGVHGTGVSQQESSKDGEDMNKSHTQHVFDDEAEDGEIRDSDDCEIDENSPYTAPKMVLKENDKEHRENEGNRIADNKRVPELLLQENREKHEQIEENITSTTSPTNDCNHQAVLEKDPGKGQRTYRVDQPREHCESHSNETKRGTKDEKDDHLSPCSIQELSLACQEDRTETVQPSNTDTLCLGTTEDKQNESVKNTTKDINKKINGICAPPIYKHEHKSNNSTELRSRCDALFGEASGKKLFEVPDYTDLMQTMYEKYVNRPHPLARYLALEREYGLDAHIEFAEESTSSDTSKKRKSSKRKKPKRDRTTSKEKNCSVVTKS